MKKIMLILTLLAVASILFLGCQKESSAEAPSAEEAEIDQSLSEVNELEEMNSELDNIDSDLDEVMIE